MALGGGRQRQVEVMVNVEEKLIISDVSGRLRKVIIANQVNKQDVFERKLAAGLLSEVRAALQLLEAF